jgi:hypothetical protein
LNTITNIAEIINHWNPKKPTLLDEHFINACTVDMISMLQLHLVLFRLGRLLSLTLSFQVLRGTGMEQVQSLGLSPPKQQKRRKGGSCVD